MEDNVITPQNLWKRMLEEKHLLKFDYGFTIPFLIGAYYKRGFLKEEDLQTSACIRFLLEKVLESATSNNPIKLFECSELKNELVFQYLDANIKNYDDIQHLVTFHPNIEHIIYWHKKETSISDFNSLVNYLWTKKSTRNSDEYSQLIENHCFSCRGGVWCPFDKDENGFITNL